MDMITEEVLDGIFDMPPELIRYEIALIDLLSMLTMAYARIAELEERV